MLHSGTVFQLHTIQEMTAQEVLMLSNQVNHRNHLKDQFSLSSWRSMAKADFSRSNRMWSWSRTSFCNECNYHQTRSTVTTEKKNIKLQKNEESCSPCFEAQDSLITKNEIKEDNIEKKHHVHWYTINRCRIATRSKW